MVNVGSWIIESTETVGTGVIVLGGKEEGFTSFSSALPDGEVWYSIEDSNGNREAGIGTFNGTNQLTRTQINFTLNDGVYSSSSPAAISLSGDAKVSCTMNANAFIQLMEHIDLGGNPHGTAAEHIAYDSSSDPVTQETTLQNAMLDQSLSIEERVASISGLRSGGIITGSGSVFTISAGTGTIYNSHSIPENTGVTSISWEDIVDTPLYTNAVNFGSTKILLDSTGQVHQVVGTISFDLFRDHIVLGTIYFVDGVITEVVNAPAVVKQTATDLYDYLATRLTINGSAIRPVDNQLAVYLNSGSIFFPGINWHTDSKNPNFALVGSVGTNTSPAPILGYTQTGAYVSTTTTIPTSINETGDSISNLSGNDATIHRLYSLGIGGSRTVIMLYGQNAYDTARVAKDNLLLDDDNTIFPTEFENGFFMGYVCVSNGTTNFIDANASWIVSASQDAGSDTASPITASGVANVPSGGLVATNVQDAINELDTELHERMLFRGDWDGAITYNSQDVVRDEGWTMISLEDGNIERPAPQPAGDPFFIYEGANPTSTPTVKQVIVGQRYSNDVAGFLNKYKIYTVAGNHYDIFYASDPLGTPVFTLLNSFKSENVGEVEFNIDPVLIPENTPFDIFVVISQPSNNPTTISGDWNYMTPANFSVPDVGEAIHPNKNRDELSISTIDDLGDNRAVDLAGLTVGDLITIGSNTWAIQSVTNNTTYYTFTVSPAIQAIPDGIQDITFELVPSSVITVVNDPNYYLSNPNVSGLYVADGDYSSINVTQDAYGIDIEVQEAIISDKWAVITPRVTTNSIGSGGGSGGGGVPEAPQDGQSYLRKDAGWEALSPSGAPVDSVFGRTGIVTAEATDYAAFYATTAQGALADTALQTLANQDIGALQNVSITSPVTGEILKYTGGNWVNQTLTEAGISNIGHAHAKSDITDFDDADYATATQGNKADSALQPGSNISELTNDAGFISAYPVDSVAGKTGVVTLNKADITDFSDGDYATAAQGVLADELNVIIANQGTAATKDVTTSATDTTAGRLTKVGDGGLLATLPPLSDLSIDYCGFSQNSAFGYIHLARSESRAGRLVCELSGSEKPYVGYEMYDPTTETQIDEVEIFNTGNLNVNKFGGSDVNELIGTGWAVSASIIWLDCGLNFKNKPTSLSVSGTFLLKDSGGVTVRSGIPASDVSIVSSLTGNKSSIIQVENNSGLTTGGEVYILRAESSGSYVEFNQ